MGLKWLHVQPFSFLASLLPYFSSHSFFFYSLYVLIFVFAIMCLCRKWKGLVFKRMMLKSHHCIEGLRLGGGLSQEGLQRWYREGGKERSRWLCAAPFFISHVLVIMAPDCNQCTVYLLFYLNLIIYLDFRFLLS